MSRAGRATAVQLDPAHEALLRVALSPDRAAEEWDALRCTRTLEGILDHLTDSDAARLLPLVFHSLSAGDGLADVPDLARLRRIAQSAAADNQVLFHRLSGALAVLAEVGVEAMALKGVPLALLYYPQPGLRPMGDADLLVKPADARTALAALRRAGWQPEWLLAPDFVERGYEVPCRSPSGDTVVDLHWRLVPWLIRDGGVEDGDLWSGATPFAIGGERPLAPASHDLLLHVILHAYRSGWDDVPRWVADAIILLRRAGDDFDWDRFVTRVTDARASLPMLDALRYLAERFDAPVPSRVLRAIDVGASRRELHKHRIASRTITADRHWLTGESRDLRTSWARSSVNLTPAGARRAVGPFLRLRMHVDRISTLPFAVIARRMRAWREPGDRLDP